MQATVNQDLCIGCGICVNMCPGCFEMKDDMKSYVIEGSDCSTEGCCEQAAGSCPVQAIEISE